MPFPAKIFALCKQINNATAETKPALKVALDAEIESSFSGEEERLRHKIAFYAMAGLFEEMEELNKKPDSKDSSSKPVSDDDLAQCFAIGGHHARVIITKENIHEIAEGYATGGHDEKVLEYVAKGAKISKIAAGYALVGRHEKVEAFLACGASKLEVSDAYKQAGDEDRAKQYRPLEEKADSFFSKAEDGFNNFVFPGTALAQRDKFYKLRLNLTSEEFQANQNEIASLIILLTKNFPGVIHSFKHILSSRGSLYEVEKDLWSAVVEGNVQKARGVYQNNKFLYDGFPEIRDERHTLLYYDSQNIQAKKIDYTKPMKEALKVAQDADGSQGRLLNQAQFTLYLKENCSPDNVARFASELTSRLQQAGFVPGSVTESDISIDRFQGFISLRHERLQNKPEEYVVAYGADPAVLESLKAEARESPLYLALNNAALSKQKEFVPLPKSLRGSEPWYKNPFFLMIAVPTVLGAAIPALMYAWSYYSKAKQSTFFGSMGAPNSILIGAAAGAIFGLLLAAYKYYKQSSQNQNSFRTQLRF